MTDTELLRAYLEEVSAGKSVKHVADKAGIDAGQLRSKLRTWKQKGLNVPSVQELKANELNEMRRVLQEFYGH